MSPIKFPQKELIFFAFVGGIVLPLLELSHMLASRENALDPYFWAGMLVAGIIGIIGLFFSQTKDIGGAIATGMCAPQLLSGITKVGPTVTSLLIGSFTTPVYAQPITQDSIHVLVIVEDSNKVIEVVSQEQLFLVKDTIHLKIPAQDTLLVSGSDLDTITLNKFDSTKDYTIKVNIVEEKQVSQNNFLRGIFGNSYRKDSTTKQKLDVQITETEKF